MGPEEGSYWILSCHWQPFWGKSCTHIIECVEWFGLEKKVRKKKFISIQFS